MALRPIAALGPAVKPSAALSDKPREDLLRMRGELEKLWTKEATPVEHFWDAAIYPVHSRERWGRTSELEKAINDRKSRGSNGHEFPPQVKGNQRKGWGIANTIYGEPWLATKTGIFMFRQPMDHSGLPYPIPRYPSYEPAAKHIAAGKWVNILSWRETVFTLFNFAQRWAGEFSPRDELIVELAAPTKGLHLVAPGRVLDRHVELIEPSTADGFDFRRQGAAEVFRMEWKDWCVDAIDEFVELFPPTMGDSFPSSREWVLSNG